MRRALDAARTRLAALTDRDAILDCFFDHSRHLFQFAVLFVIRGDTAHGRNVHGLGAPDGLVARLNFPVDVPGLFARARELRRPFATTASGAEADERLFGTLGRMMPAGLAVPLVVRDRVVALLLGDAPSETVQTGAREAGRSAGDLAKEEMLLWADSVSEALERMIMRRKGAGGSVPPPGLAGRTPSGRPGPSSPSSPPGPSWESFAPPPPRLPTFAAVEERSMTGVSETSPDAAANEEAAPSDTTMTPGMRRLVVGATIAAALAAAAIALFTLRTKPGGHTLAVPGRELQGWPKAVPPLSVLETARKVSGLGEAAQLSSIRAEIGDNGLVDLEVPPASTESTHLAFGFLTPDVFTDVRVEADGVHGPRSQARSLCTREECGEPLPAPHCTFAEVYAATREAGLGEHERAFVKYGIGRVEGATAQPEWTASVAGRGVVHIDAQTCRLRARELLRPAPKPLASLPGAPKAVDPMAMLELAKAQSGLGADAILIDLDARGVDRRGLVDIGDRRNSVSYAFSDPPKESAERRWRHVKVDADGMTLAPADEDRPSGVALQSGAPPAPLCSVAHALEFMTRDVPADGTRARVTFGTDIVSPGVGQWSMESTTIGLRKKVSDSECEFWVRARNNPATTPTPRKR